MGIFSIGGPACNPSHFEPFALLSPDEFRSRKHADKLFAKVVRQACGLRRSRDEDFWGDAGVENTREVLGERVSSNVGSRFVFGLDDRLWSRVFLFVLGEGGRTCFRFDVGISREHGRVVFASVIERARDILRKTLLWTRGLFKIYLSRIVRRQRTFLMRGSSASTFAWASLFCSLPCRFSFFCLRAISSRLILFLMEDGSNRVEGMVGGGSRQAGSGEHCEIHRLSESPTESLQFGSQASFPRYIPLPRHDHRRPRLVLSSAMALLRKPPLLSLCLLLVFAAAVNALHFYLDTDEKRCFIEELPSETVVEGVCYVAPRHDALGAYASSSPCRTLHGPRVVRKRPEVYREPQPWYPGRS